MCQSPWKKSNSLVEKKCNIILEKSEMFFLKEKCDILFEK